MIDLGTNPADRYFRTTAASHFFERRHMALEIVVRSRRGGGRSPETTSRDNLVPSRKAVDLVQPANDNDKTWPLIPFPDGWWGG
jgi:hypothetical protein